MPIHELASMTWTDVQAVVARGAEVVAVLPLGAVEAHGPHLPLGTDIVIAEAMARDGAERLSRRGLDVILVPALPVAPAPFAAAFAGTIDTPASATTAMLVGIARSLHQHGVRCTLIANAHHDPTHVDAIRAAVADAASSGVTIIFPDLTRRRWAERLTDEFRSGACHAGRYEGSIVLAAAPQLVQTTRAAGLAPNPRSLVDAIRRGDRTFADAGGPDAYFGWPADASAKEGREIIERLGAIVEDVVMDAVGTKNDERRAKNDNVETKNTEHDATGADGSLLPINPPGLGRPHGFSHGILAPAGSRMLAVAGQTATDGHGLVTETDFAAQFGLALGRIIDVVREAGGEALDITRMTIYVTDLDRYRRARERLGDVWQSHMGRHYPAMALVEVKGLVDPGALVEIEADAAIPPIASGGAAAGGR
jgi:creatinine amidohydrolase